MGIGQDNVYLVRTDSRGKMVPDDLEKCIKKSVEDGAKPFLVSATAGE